jgi:hypothetical protein
MARYAKTCTDADYFDLFIAIRDDLNARGYQVISGEYGAGILDIGTDLPLPQDVMDLWGLTEVP